MAVIIGPLHFKTNHYKFSDHKLFYASDFCKTMRLINKPIGKLTTIDQIKLKTEINGKAKKDAFLSFA